MHEPAPNFNLNEIHKLQKYVTLLKEEYNKLLVIKADLEQKNNRLSVANGEICENNFVARLLRVVSGLYDNPMYSDLSIVFSNRTIPAHKLVLNARNSSWAGVNLSDVDTLEWSHMEGDVGLLFVKWIYSDQIDFSRGGDFTLKMITLAKQYDLPDLFSKCETALMATVDVKNCVLFYTTADEIKAETLKNHCSSLISANWENFTSEDFAHMSANLLYHMFKSKTKFPLHSAVRLRREDVVFLYLVEHDSQLSRCLNELDNRGEIALDLALRDRQTGIAKILLEHKADPDARDSKGWTILHRAVEKGDGFTANFLLEHGASISIVTPERGDTALHLIASSSPTSSMDDSFEMLNSVAALLLEKGLNPNIQNKQGFTALHLTVMAKNEQLFDLLLSRKEVDLNARTIDDHTPLYYALISESTNYFAKKLVEENGAQANPIYSKNSMTLLHLVADDCLEDAALFICSHTDNIDQVNRRGESALHVACERGLVRLISKLLEMGADPNLTTAIPDSIAAGEEDIICSSYRLTPILTAILNRHQDAVKTMIQFFSKAGSKIKTVMNLNLKDSKGDSALTLALSMGMEHLVPDLISAGADVNIRNGQGLTLLHQAIIQNDSKTAIFLLNQGADIDAKTLDNLSPLQLAIKFKVAAVVEDLCKKGVDLSIPNEKGDCPLWVALYQNDEDVASILVRYGVDTDCWTEGPGRCMQTLLHRAIDERLESAARFLIQSGCDLNSPRKPSIGGRGGDEAFDLQTPLHLCCSWGLESVAQVLIEHGADVNIKDIDSKTPLHVAVDNQQDGIISLLLCHPAIDVSLVVRDKSGLTPFAASLTCRNDRAARAILKKMPTAAEQYDNKGRNFLHMAIQKIDIESILFLLQIHVNVNSRVQDANQATPLHLAARSNNEMLVRSLMLAGARVNDRDSRNQTPLHVACEVGFAPVISALLSQGIDYDVCDNDGNNALHIACREGHSSAVKTLLSESSINAETENARGRTPLHMLAKYAKDNASVICELFLMYIEDYPLNRPDAEGNTALILAYMKGNGNLCRTLVNAGASVGAMNKQGITIFNYQVATRQLLNNLLDQLSKEPSWIEGETCQECDSRFGLTMRKHHCRHCGRLLCSKCAARDIPIIKYGISKPVRVCVTCFDVLQGTS